MSAGSKSSDGLDDATCTIMETSMLEEEGYFDPAEGSGAGLSGAGGKKRLESLCRVCANVSDYFIPVFEREGAEHQLDMKIRKHLPIRVLETDGLPAQVCYQCASTLIAWHDLVTACVEADKKLHRLLLEEEDDDYADRDEKVVEFFNEPPVDSDGEDFSEPSTSAAVVETKECLPPQKKRTSGKGKQQRKAQRASNASPESGAKGNTALSDSKETGAGQKGAVDSALSTERSRAALKIIRSTPLDAREIRKHATSNEAENYDPSGDSEDEDGDFEGSWEGSNSDFESSSVWPPNIHSYCKVEISEGLDPLAEDDRALLDRWEVEQLKMPNGRSKPRARAKPHIIELESYDDPFETKDSDTNTFVCHVCGVNIAGDVEDVDEHLKSHDQPRENDDIGGIELYGDDENFDRDVDVDSSVEELDSSLDDSDVKEITEFYCEVCGECFENNGDLTLHKKRDHDAPSPRVISVNHQGSLRVRGDVGRCGDQIVATKRKRNVFVCRACKAEFPDFASFQQHRPMQAKKSKFGELIRNACTRFFPADLNAHHKRKKYLLKKHEQPEETKKPRITQEVHDACGELLTADLSVQDYLFKQLQKEQQAFRIKHRKKFYRRRIW
ncbi:uncharacterized protein LOC134532306 isoform X7 [Bacillus rossius redtenbacheri]|uniref:uncharacterized protein LOC134532306 isoform X7 n=1 Tax=Bacillus rossius redtenbacheri TaxID=93214 RepID=UPI002FDDC956